MKNEYVILVDARDNETGTMPKLDAHIQNKLHRAFSVFIFNTEGKMLLQKRNMNKYHSGGLWTNACCGHPRPGEETLDAANRRLFEEMGFETVLKKEADFMYCASFENGLYENEFDHVFFGTYNGIPKHNPDEVDEWKFVNLDWLFEDVLLNPENYTVWFKICIDKLLLHRH